MKRVKVFCLLLTCVLLTTRCTDDQKVLSDDDLDIELNDLIMAVNPNMGKTGFILPSSTDLNKIPQDPNNPLTTEKVILGQLLYHETALGVESKYQGGNFTYSCASCHHADAGFQAGRRQGLGDGGDGFGFNGEGRKLDADCPVDSIDVQPIRSPSALNIAFVPNTLWNGQFGATGVNVGTEANWTPGTPIETNKLGFEGTETQAIAGLKVHRLNIDTTFINNTNYKELFDRAFPDVPMGERYTRVTSGLAIAAYERTLLANKAPFQSWLRGNADAMTDQEKRGAILFFGKANCVSCHQGPALNHETEFFAIGMNDLVGPEIFHSTPENPAHLGRASFTGNPDDKYKFKVPQLYNLGEAVFLGHGGNFTSIRQVVEYKNNGIPENDRVPLSQLSDEFVPLLLDDQEVNDLTIFLESALKDPDLNRYVPSTLPSGLCFPNNDMSSRLDLGCY